MQTDYAKKLTVDLENGLRRILGNPGDCALLLYRNNANAGDAAIWVSQIRVLQRLGFTVTYAAARDEFSAEEFKRRAPTCPILISGGGSLGTQWPKTHAFKERIIEQFPDRQIVILPQSGRFADDQSRERFIAIASSHSRLTVIARDRATLEELADVDCAKKLLPDLAVALWDHKYIIRNAGASDGGIRYLLRRDGEAPGHSTEVESVDWQDPARVFWVRRFEKHLLRSHPRFLVDAKAAWRLDRGLQLLQGASVVVTDRLHGFLLAYLLGIPTVVLDNNWGEVRAFYETWFDDDPLVRWAGDLGEAHSLATEMGP